MRYVSGIEIDQAIFHLINPRRTSMPVYSESALSLAGNTALATYFVDHIEASLGDATSKAARFTDLSGGDTAGICADVFNGSTNLVQASRQLAERLRAIMEQDGRIAGGDLAVCLYRATSEPHVPYYIALLKIDSSKVLRPRTVQDAQGNVSVDLDVVDDALPTARERLQKCAFIQPLDPRPEYDMVLLDRQSGPGRADQVARFFVDGFMGASMALDPRKRTHLFYRGMVSAQNALREELSSSQEETLRGAIEQALSSAVVNVDTVVESLPLSETQKEHVNQIVSEVLPDREFEIDATYKESLLRRRVFRGDHGLRVTVQADQFNQVIQSVEPVDDGSGPAYFRVVLHTEKWEEVPR